MPAIVEFYYDLASPNAYLANKVLQGIGRRKLSLLPKPGNEFDMNVLAVDVPVEVEDMHLEQWLHPIERWPGADARDAVQRRTVDAMDAYREYTHHRALPALKIDVGGRIAEIAAETLPGNDTPGHPVRSTKQPFRALHVARP